MFYVYSPSRLPEANAIAAGLGGVCTRNFDGMHFRRHGKPIEFAGDDVVVCWERRLPQLGHVKMLNANARMAGQNELHKLVSAYSAQLGFAAVPEIPVSPKSLAEIYASIRSGVNKKIKYIPYKENPGFVFQKIDYKSEYKFYIFGSQIVKAKHSAGIFKPYKPIEVVACSQTAVKAASDLFNLLGLDFCVITIMEMANMFDASFCVYYTRKVVTSPHGLSSDEITMFVEEIIKLKGKR
jgi:hypothetical protein